MGKREKIIEEALALAVDGKLDLSELRNNHKSLYQAIANKFDNIEEFKKAVKPIECVYQAQRKAYKKRLDKHLPSIRLSLRNILALERLTELRLNYPFERIAEMYNVSRQAIHQLQEALEEAAKNVDVTEMQDYNQNTTD